MNKRRPTCSLPFGQLRHRGVSSPGCLFSALLQRSHLCNAAFRRAPNFLGSFDQGVSLYRVGFVWILRISPPAKCTRPGERKRKEQSEDIWWRKRLFFFLALGRLGTLTAHRILPRPRNCRSLSCHVFMEHGNGYMAQYITYLSFSNPGALHLLFVPIRAVFDIKSSMSGLDTMCCANQTSNHEPPVARSCICSAAAQSCETRSLQSTSDVSKNIESRPTSRVSFELAQHSWDEPAAVMAIMYVPQAQVLTHTDTDMPLPGSDEMR